MAKKLAFHCNNKYCGSSTQFYTSTKCKDESNTPGPKVFEVNYKFVLGMRLIGRGLTAMNLVCGMLNMPQAMQQKCYESILRRIEIASETVAQESMKNAANELKDGSSDVKDVKCMFDGTWQRRGFSSLVGAVPCLSTDSGKVIEKEVLRKHCKVCQTLQKLDITTEKFQRLRAEHNCQKNHTSSSAAMEIDGVRRVFGRSVKERGLRYTKYIGDGDSKTYETIKNEKPYGDDTIIEKIECVGHVQKRLGTALRKLKTICGKQKLCDGKSIGGRGRLTKKEIDKLQVYYGLAIRRNVGNVDKMKEAIDAILRHRISTDQLHNHTNCPKGSDSWCAFQRCQGKDYHHKNPLAKAVAVKIKPIFDRLSVRSLLLRCVHGFTQNAAESYNNVLWSLCPKGTFVGAVPINVCASLSVIIYNDGYGKLKLILDELGIDFGKYIRDALQKKDDIRLYQSKRKACEEEKKIRKAQRKRRLEEEDRFVEQEGTIYEPGGF